MFKVEAITPAIGAEVSGVSLNKDLNSDTVEKIYNTLIKHQVIFFREQNLTPESHLISRLQVQVLPGALYFK